MAARLIKKSWWVDFRADHTRYRKRSPENSRSGAHAYEATLRQRLARGEDINRAAALLPPSFEEFAWQWLDDYVVPNNKYSEQRTKRYILTASLVPFFGKMAVHKITTHDVERFKATLTKDGVSAKTVNNRLTVLSTCLSTAHEWLQIETAPPKIKRLKCSPSKTDYLSPQECALLLSNADGIVRELILVALRTGMRQGELRGLQWESIDWQNRSLIVRHSHCDYRNVLVSPKSNRERHIPLDVDVLEVLSKRKRDTGYVFVDVDRQPFDHHRMGDVLADVCRRAGLRRITWHVLRHTFASHLAMRGVPLNVVQTLLGHSTIVITMRYAHVAPSTLRSAIEFLNPRTMLTADHGQPVGNQWLELQRREADQKEAT